MPPKNNPTKNDINEKNINDLQETVDELQETVMRLLERLELAEEKIVVLENEVESLKNSAVSNIEDSTRTLVKMLIYFKDEKPKFLNCIIKYKEKKIIGSTKVHFLAKSLLAITRTIIATIEKVGENKMDFEIYFTDSSPTDAAKVVEAIEKKMFSRDMAGEGKCLFSNIIEKINLNIITIKKIDSSIFSIEEKEIVEIERGFLKLSNFSWSEL